MGDHLALAYQRPLWHEQNLGAPLKSLLMHNANVITGDVILHPELEFSRQVHIFFIIPHPTL